MHSVFHLSNVDWLSSCTCWMVPLHRLPAVASCKNPITPPGGLHEEAEVVLLLLAICTTMRILDDPPLLLVAQLGLPPISTAAALAHTVLATLHAAPAHAPTLLQTVLGLGGVRPSARSRRHVRLTSAVAFNASAAALLLQESGCRTITVSAASAATPSRSLALAGRPDLQKRRRCLLSLLNTAANAASRLALLGSASTTIGRLYSLLWQSDCAWLSCFSRDRAWAFQLRMTTWPVSGSRTSPVRMACSCNQVQNNKQWCQHYWWQVVTFVLLLVLLKVLADCLTAVQ